MSYIINSYRFKSGLLLDNYPATAAYSLQKLRDAQTNAIRVRETGGNTESDIGFSGNNLNASSLTTFTGSNSGEMRTWYDQSGNGNNVEQTTSGKQPQIVNAGAIETDGNDYGVLFTKANADVMTCPVVTTGSVYSVFAVVKFTNTSSQYSPIFLNGTASGFGVYTEPGLDYVAFSRGIGGKILDPVPSTTNLLTVIRLSDTDMKAYINGSLVYDGSANTMTTPSGTFYLGGSDFNEFFGGHILEFILYASDQSSNRTAIEADINSRYVNI